MSKRAKYDPLTVLQGGDASEQSSPPDAKAETALKTATPPAENTSSSRPSPTTRSRTDRTQLNVSISPEAKARLDDMMNVLPRSVTRADVIEYFILEHGDEAASHLQET